jgi:hypothetical protein
MSGATLSPTHDTSEFSILYDKLHRDELASVSEAKKEARNLGWPLRQTDIFFTGDGCRPFLRVEMVSKSKQ